MPRQRSSSNTGGTTRKTGGSGSRNAATPPSIRGEKRVKETRASVPVGPPRRRRGTHDGPTDPAAIDRRKEFTGTDQPADAGSAKPARRSRGGATR